MTSEKKRQVGFVVFTGPYEVHYQMSDAEQRLEELLDSGHDRPTVIKVELTEEHDGDGSSLEPLGLTARKVIDTARSGEIR